MVTTWRKSSLLKHNTIFFFINNKVGFVFKPTSFLCNVSKIWCRCLVKRNERRVAEWKGERGRENEEKKINFNVTYLIWYEIIFFLLFPSSFPFFSSPFLTIFSNQTCQRWRQDAVRKTCNFHAKQSVMIKFTINGGWSVPCTKIT